MWRDLFQRRVAVLGIDLNEAASARMDDCAELASPIDRRVDRMPNDLERAREWLEWVYVNGRGAPSDHASALIELIDDQEWFEGLNEYFDELAEFVDHKKPTDADQLTAIVDHVERELALLADIRETLTNAGAIDDKSDIPTTLRLLLGP